MQALTWNPNEEAHYREIFERVRTHLDEKSRRLLGAAMALSLGPGNRGAIHAVTGLSLDTLQRGVAPLRGELPLPASQSRRAGGGRKPITEIYPEVLPALLRLVSEDTPGDPESPLLGTTKSLSHLADALTQQGRPVSPMTVSRLLAEQGYSMQANRKRFDHGSDHPNRNPQFAYIAAQTQAYQDRGQPVISVDTKKKDLVGRYKNGGREYRPAGSPVEVNAHDVPDKTLGQAIPYGVYDPISNTGWVNVGVDHDTADFAGASIRQWWVRMGREAYPDAPKLLLTADGGGRNGYRLNGFKVALQQFADATGLAITVNHFPPGTSKWHAIEHRMFSALSLNGRGRPLTSLKTIGQLIGHTRTKTGLTIQAALDPGTYPVGQKPDPQVVAQLQIERPQGQNDRWNYTIRPRVKTVT